MLKRKMIRPWNLCTVIEMCTIVIMSSCTASEEPCYCLSEELGSLRNPVHIEATTVNGENAYLVAEQRGVIYEYRPSMSQIKLRTYINITNLVVCKPIPSEERGLLGFALHPHFADNKKLYTYSVRSLNGSDYAVVSEIVDADVNNERLLMHIKQPGQTRNGGQLLFGDDGYLYVFVGDGGPKPGDDNDAQNGLSLLGKVLRIDVNRITVSDYRLRYYDIPNDNPKRRDWKPEVFAIGVRNMWRCWQDNVHSPSQDENRIFCGDLGSNKSDEINVIKKGANYGWNFKEGTICLNDTSCEILSLKDRNEELPIHEFKRGVSNITSIVLGPMYRASLFPKLSGHLIFGNFDQGDTYTLKKSNESKWEQKRFSLCDLDRCGCGSRAFKRSMLLSFGKTHDDELLLLMTDGPTPSNATGALLRLRPPDQSHQVTCACSIIFSNLCNCVLVINVFVSFLGTGLVIDWKMYVCLFCTSKQNTICKFITNNVYGSNHATKC